MNTDPATAQNHRSARVSARLCLVLALLLIVMEAAPVFSSPAENSSFVGTWRVTVVFPNGESRSIRFDAQAGGSGSFRLLNSAVQSGDRAKSSAATWSEGDGDSIIFSGPIIFPLGNVGRAPGTLHLTGRRQGPSQIKGDATFTSDDGTQPAKRGTFVATRVRDS